ncbi:uncharacterized protein [Engystomops pustulosus]|uniref:uncharacterized protein isoform X2 n=1 Tax=Engystomops pustulosus TaxID=76066 RepID=UPI003AFA7596
MSLSQWISSVFQLQGQTSSHLHLLHEDQPLQPRRPPRQVELTGARNVGSDGRHDLFQKVVADLGGKENILLVGEAGYCPGDDGGSSGMLEGLSSALFQSPRRANFLKNVKSPVTGSNTSLTCVTSRSPAKSRTLEYPIILGVFRASRIMDSTELVKEILMDVQLRTREFGSTIVGIVFSRERLEEEKKNESKEQMKNVMSQVFKNQRWGVCSYSSSEPGSILGVKQMINETMGVTDGYQVIEEDSIEVERSFQELVRQLGGKERFLLLGNICSSAHNSEKAQVFKEITKALFDDYEEVDKVVAPERPKKSTECVQLPKPRPFPYPLILVVFRSTFLKLEVNMVQVREILADIKERITMSSTKVIGVICSEEPLEKMVEDKYQILLKKILHQTFSCPIGVCSFVRTSLESAEEVKRCVCDVMNGHHR